MLVLVSACRPQWIHTIENVPGLLESCPTLLKIKSSTHNKELKEIVLSKITKPARLTFFRGTQKKIFWTNWFFSYNSLQHALCQHCTAFNSHCGVKKFPPKTNKNIYVAFTLGSFEVFFPAESSTFSPLFGFVYASSDQTCFWRVNALQSLALILIKLANRSIQT